MNNNNILVGIIKNSLKRSIRCVNMTLWIKRNGVSFRVPILRGVGTQNIKKTEPWMIELLKIFYSGQEESIFIDIGANLGQTLLKFRSISPHIPYYGFEPNPVCCNYVEELIRLNALEQATLFPVAIGEKTDIISLYIHDSEDIADSSASVLKDFKNSVISFQKNIPVFPLDFFYTRYFPKTKINLIKIDVEGAELETIKGSLEVIRSQMPVISCELLPPINNMTRSETLNKKENIQKLLEPIGYDFYKIQKNRKNGIKNLHKIQDIAQETVKSEGWDYLFVPLVWSDFLQRKFSVEE